jgi:hypothetical protein
MTCSTDIVLAEKAIATLHNHPHIMSHGITVSPSPNGLPLPFPDPPTPARGIRPLRQVIYAEVAEDDDSTASFMKQCPTPGELFDAIREWGSLRSVGVWADGIGGDVPTTWGGMVEFWYEDEAARFDAGFGQTGSLVKGWQM